METVTTDRAMRLGKNHQLLLVDYEDKVMFPRLACRHNLPLETLWTVTHDTEANEKLFYDRTICILRYAHKKSQYAMFTSLEELTDYIESGAVTVVKTNKGGEDNA